MITDHIVPCDIDDPQGDNLSMYWTVKCLHVLNAHKAFLKGNHFEENDLAIKIGLEEYVEGSKPYDRKAILAHIQHAYEMYANASLHCNAVLLNNIEACSGLMQLNALEKKILLFVCVSNHDLYLETALSLLGYLTTLDLYKYLSLLLDEPIACIRDSLQNDAMLITSGLVTCSSQPRPFCTKLQFFSHKALHVMLSHPKGMAQIIKLVALPCSNATLVMKDYDHLHGLETLALAYMKAGVTHKSRGINLLLYGPAGTGKTEFAKTIAQEIGAALYQVSYFEANDEAADADSRLKWYSMAQNFYQNTPCLLLFDEVEDIFKSYHGTPFSAPKKQNGKLWLNSMLESNPVPTVWITNDIHSIDQAIVRRFGMCMELGIPPQKKRKEILKALCQGIVNQKHLQRLARHETLSPAVIAHAAEVVLSMKEDVKNSSKATMDIVNQTLKAQRYTPIEKENAQTRALPSSYSPSFINTSVGVHHLTKGISKTKNIRLCLYGPPGTGKSAFGLWLAKQLKQRCIVKKGSDLLSKFLGETEKNIADAFEEASASKAVLIFDEIDSFLQERSQASHSWEITQVNEMLVQMESFHGVFIATTNLIENLDHASLRRFDMKLLFDYMTQKQALELFEKECHFLKIPLFGAFEQELHLPSLLTPGDFATVKRQHRFNPIDSVDDFIDRLHQECTLKEGVRRKPIGF